VAAVTPTYNQRRSLVHDSLVAQTFRDLESVEQASSLAMDSYADRRA
jgi:hypothetical protein